MKKERVKEKILKEKADSSFSLYLHIPFCAKICPYCDFTKFARRNIPEDEYVLLLEKELALYAEDDRFKNKKVDTIFWGGGTPSLFAPNSFAQLQNQAKNVFDFNDDSIEITIESNPQDLTAEYTDLLLNAGVNRVSIGAQSVNSKALKFLGREHSREDVKAAVVNCQNIGIKNISLDLIFALPDQSEQALLEDLEFFTSLNVQHISAYNLTIEKGTPFFQAVSDNVFTPLVDEKARALYLQVISYLKEKKYQQYEVSNFSRDSFRCKHNTAYWKRKNYLGLGVGAHSFSRFDVEQRWANTSSLNEYKKKLSSDLLPVAWCEELSADEIRSEEIMLGIRMCEGLKVEDLNKESLQNVMMTDFVEQIGDKVVLTESGFACADTVGSILMK